MNTGEFIEPLKLALADTLPESVTALYLYGSIIEGKLRADSDIDAAVLPVPACDSLAALELISKTEGALEAFFRNRDLIHEVSVLNMRGKYISCQLLYKVVTEGLLVFERDGFGRLEFENTVKGEYFDFKPYLNSFRKNRYGNIYQKI